MTSNAGLWTDAEKAQARDCLERILGSAPFAQSERLRRFLQFIVTQTMAGDASRLKGYVIAMEVFDRDPGFDPAISALVRVEAARLRTKLREYYEDHGRDDPVRLVLPKGRYAIELEVRQPDTQAPPPAADAGAKPSLAVLPFTNLTGDAGQDYFADGVTDTLITELSRLPELLVISRQSSFAYRDVSLRAQEIARELGVRYLVEGSVQRAGGQVRITAQLIDGGSGAHLWAERFDRQIKDAFQVQDDVVRHILEVLQVRIAAAPGPERLAREASPGRIEASDCVLRGLERFWVYTPEATEAAKGYFTRAMTLDPAAAAPRAWLARALVFRWIMCWEDTPDALEQAYLHARAAVDLGSRFPQAYTVLSWVQLWRGQCAAAAASGRHAVMLDPNNADAHMFLAHALSMCGKSQEAALHIETAMRLNPHPPALYHFTLGQCFYVLGDYTKALEAFKSGVKAWNAFLPNHYYLCLIYARLGREEEAAAERDTLMALHGGRMPVVRQLQLQAGIDPELLRRAGLIID